MLEGEAKEFVLDLIRDKEVRSKKCPDNFYPYTEDAIDWIVTEVGKQTDLTPRNIMRFLDYVTSKAEEVIYPERITIEFLEKLEAFEPFRFDTY